MWLWCGRKMISMHVSNFEVVNNNVADVLDAPLEQVVAHVSCIHVLSVQNFFWKDKMMAENIP